MSQRDVLEFLGEQLNRNWFTSKEIASGTKQSLPRATENLRKVRRREEIEYKKIGNRGAYAYRRRKLENV